MRRARASYCAPGGLITRPGLFSLVPGHQEQEPRWLCLRYLMGTITLRTLPKIKYKQWISSGLGGWEKNSAAQPSIVRGCPMDEEEEMPFHKTCNYKYAEK